MEAKLMKLVIEESSVSSVRVQKVYGRLLGFIDEKECKAVLNTEGAARKIFTSESAQLKDYAGTIIGSRLVFATYSSDETSEWQGDKDLHRKILISPVIRSLHCSRSHGRQAVSPSSTKFRCDGAKSYTLQEASGD